MERETWMQAFIRHFQPANPIEPAEARALAHRAGVLADAITEEFRKRYPDPVAKPPAAPAEVVNRSVTPTMQEQQVQHFCCRCGKRILTPMAMCAVVSVDRGSFSTRARIAWCGRCWDWENMPEHEPFKGAP